MENLKKNIKIVIPENDVGYDSKVFKLEGNEWEWKILEMLISSQINEFINYSTIEQVSHTNQNLSDPPKVSGEQKTYGDDNKSNVLMNNFMETKKKLSSRGRSRRRQLILECRKLRSEITLFEEEFSAANSRSPKASDRGAMSQVYTHYKNLKRLVRDEAATDIQRVYRGMVVRMELQMMSELMGNSHESSPRSPRLSDDYIESDIASNPVGHQNIIPRRDNRGSSSRRYFSKLSIASHQILSSAHTTRVTESINNEIVDEHPSSQIRKRKGIEMPSQSQSATGAIPAWLTSEDGLEVRRRYRQAYQIKAVLKSKLKKFDDDFKKVNGRLPTRSEKEAVRTVYEQYHVVKGEMTKLQIQAETQCGLDLSEDVLVAEVDNSPRERGLDRSKRGGFSISRPSSFNNKSDLSQLLLPATQGDDTNNRSRAGSGELLISNSLVRKNSVGDSSDALYLSDIEDNKGNMSPMTSMQWSEVSSPAITSRSESGNINSGTNQESLQNERKQLLICLKSYEKEFTRINSRPVTRHEDILPVAAEYKRYKEIKMLLQDNK